MAARDGTRRPDKFHVGQIVVLDPNPKGGWGRVRGELAIIVGSKRFGEWRCGARDGSEPATVEPGYRYLVEWREGTSNFGEESLRAIYDGEPVSTWAKFERATGIRVTVAAPRRPRRRKAAAQESRGAPLRNIRLG